MMLISPKIAANSANSSAMPRGALAAPPSGPDAQAFDNSPWPERTAKTGNEGYPPYNIELIGEDRYRITMAVAGFVQEDLDIQVEKQTLAVTGRRTAEWDKRPSSGPRSEIRNRQ